MRRLWFALITCLLAHQAESSQTLSFRTTPRVITHFDSAAPLTAEIEVLTNEMTALEIELRTADDIEIVPSDGLRRDHRVQLLGLRPSRNYRVSVLAKEQGGASVRWQSAEFKAPPLPELFPPFKILVSKPEEMEPGVTIFNLNSAPSGDPSYIVAVNAIGEVVWYYKASARVTDVRRLRDGNILYVAPVGLIQNRAIEIDMLGNVVRRWQAAISPREEGGIDLATDSIHHEMFEMPNGNFLALSSALRKFDNYWTSETDPKAAKQTANVVDDVVVEFKPNGEILKRWSMMDLLDPYRIGYGSLGRGWNAAYPNAGGPTHDWGHGNAVIWDEPDDSIIVSLYTQDVVLKFSRPTGKLIWILGNHDDWPERLQPFLLKPAGGADFEWPYHQHAPELTPSGTLLVFDNGAYRARPFKQATPDETAYSRAVEYSIDEAGRTITQIWRYGGPGDEKFFSRPLGDVDWLPFTGNILVTDGFHSDPNPPNIWARVIEVTHTSPAKKVFELNVHVPGREGSTGWYIYRAERLRSLYPGN